MINHAKRLAEFGFDREKLIHRLFHRGTLPAPLLANAIPKSGTNLLLRLLILIPSYSRTLQKTVSSTDANELEKALLKIKNGKFLTGHVKYSDQKSTLIHSAHVKHVFMIRHPLDVALSNVRYITYQDKNHRLHNYFANTLDNDRDRFIASLKGIPSSELNGQEKSMSIAEHYRGYMGWLDDPECFLMRFEDIIGPEGGGDAELQRQSISGLLRYLNLDQSEQLLDYLCTNLFSNKSRTFHKGQIGLWQKFVIDHSLESEIIDDKVSSIISELGYNSRLHNDIL